MIPSTALRDFFILIGVMTIGVVLAGIYVSSPRTEEILLSPAEVMVELQQIRERLDVLTASVEKLSKEGIK